MSTDAEDDDIFLDRDDEDNNNHGEIDDDDDEEETPGDFEIVGLHSATNGRSCSVHHCCGLNVKKGDVLRIVRTTVEIRNVLEPALKLVRVVDGADGCTVGFVPRIQANLEHVLNSINNFCVVQEMYETSPNTYKREKSHKNMGMASVNLLREIPRDEYNN
jgi:hypothetical protein